MDPHPDFAAVDLPRGAELSGFTLTPLGPEVTDEDYRAVMASEAALDGLWGGWPSGLTCDANALDLAWHEREFSLKRSFSWVVRDPAGQYLGCLYLFPDPGRRGSAEAVLWVRDCPDRAVKLRKMLAAASAWIESRIPDGIVLRWRTSPKLQVTGDSAGQVGLDHPG